MICVEVLCIRVYALIPNNCTLMFAVNEGVVTRHRASSDGLAKCSVTAWDWLDFDKIPTEDSNLKAANGLPATSRLSPSCYDKCKPNYSIE